MRLKQLTMHNFGPYRDEVVDFTAFEQTQLFLISGKTGSGKTTIFDALVYALYGTTTGGERTGTEMRANFATPKEATAVRLTFSHGGRDYLIRRAPEQLLAKKRGTGLTKVAAKVSLTIYVAGEEETELTKVQAVRDRIQNLLQLDADQFRQMVLLPQGKFRQFLDANSEAKGALLRHLFGTELFARWQATLQDAAKQQSKTIAAQQARLEALAAQFDYGAAKPQPHATLAEQLAAMQAVVATQQAAVAAAEAQMNQAKQAFARANGAYHRGDILHAAYANKQQAEAQLAELAQKKPQVEAWSERLANLQWAHEWASVADRIAAHEAQQTKLTTAINQTTADLTQAQAALQAATAEQESLEQQAPTQAAAEQRLQTLAALQAQLEEVAEASQRVANAQKHQTQATEAQRQAQAEVVTVDQAVTANRQAQAALRQAPVASDLQAQETLVARLSGLAHQLEQGQQRLAQLQQHQATLAAATAGHQAAVAAAQAQYTRLHDQRLNNQIAALVAQLSPEAPCPVCGSREHPHPATVAAQAAVTPEALQAADERRTATQADWVKHQEQQAQLQTQLAQHQHDQTALEDQIQAVAGAAAASSAQETLTAQTHKLAVLRQEASAQQAQQQALEAEAKGLETEQQQAHERLATSTTQQQAAQVAAATATAKLAAAQQQLPQQVPTSTTIAREQETLQTQVAAYDQAVAANKPRVQTARDQQTRLQTQLGDQQAQLQATAAELAVAQQQLTQALVAHQATDEATFAAWVADAAAIPELQQRVAAIHEATARQQALLEAATTQIGNQPQPDLAGLQQARDLADQAATDAQKTWARLSQQHQQAAHLVQQMQMDYQRNQAALNVGVAMQNLAAIVNGNNAQKLSLERYVLRAYLQQVLVVANRRLEGLSDGRYQLLLHQDPGSYRNDSGLEIDVYDDQVGETRSVHTLSGGESFIAALALALALGEVIQQTAGGITIDALFIDEGFGSLDSASLETALQALETIEGQSRMIGIISHVESLRAGIADQLRVRPSGAGDSHIQVVHLDQ